MKNLIIRTIVAFIVGPLIVVLFYIGGWWLAIPLGLLSCTISFEVLLNIPNAIKPWRRASIALFSGLMAPCWYMWQWEGFLSFMTIAIAFIAFTELTEDISGTKQRISFGLFSLLYPSIAGISVLALHRISGDIAVYILISIWSADTFAYFAGVLFGKNRMSPLISPNKTWEGLGGAVIGGVITALVFSLVTSYSIAIFLPMGLVIAVVAQLGDLVESKLKREAGIKDSSNLIPGHGGFLDRFDSFLFVYPIAYLILHHIFS